MQSRAPIHIHICHPEVSFTSTNLAVKEISHSIKNGSVGYAGFATKKGFEQYLLSAYSPNEHVVIKKLSPSNQKKIERTCEKAAQAAAKLLPSNKAMSIYVFPWLHETEQDKIFEGVTGYTPYAGTIHIFLSQRTFDYGALAQTVVHEYNHAVYFSMQLPPRTLLQTMIFEGLADHFCEEVLNSLRAHWSQSLSNQKSLKLFEILKESKKLNSTSFKLYKDVFFGSKTYERWTGYTLGYEIIKKFRNRYPHLSWQEILSLTANKIFTLSGYDKN